MGNVMEVTAEFFLALTAALVGVLFWCFRLESRQQKMIETLDRMAKESHEWRTAQNVEHKEMIMILQGMREPLIEAVTLLKNHIHEERAKTD